MSDFFVLYREDVLGICYYYTRDAELSKDLTMDTFETYLKRDKNSPAINDIKSYLLGIARNLCMAHFKKAKRTQSVEDSLNQIMENEEEITHSSNGDEKIDRLMSALCQLTDDQRRCVELFFLKGFSYNQISKKLNFSYNEVKSFIQNGKRNLKNLMTNSGT